jgi:hypothetical protein
MLKQVAVRSIKSSPFSAQPNTSKVYLAFAAKLRTSLSRLYHADWLAPPASDTIAPLALEKELYRAYLRAFL